MLCLVFLMLMVSMFGRVCLIIVVIGADVIRLCVLIIIIDLVGILLRCWIMLKFLSEWIMFVKVFGFVFCIIL